MRHVIWSSAFVIAVIGASVAIARGQRGPVVPQMRGDGPPPEARPFSITRADHSHEPWRPGSTPRQPRSGHPRLAAREARQTERPSEP